MPILLFIHLSNCLVAALGSGLYVLGVTKPGIEAGKWSLFEYRYSSNHLTHCWLAKTELFRKHQ